MRRVEQMRAPATEHGAPARSGRLHAEAEN
jgi:hypothetical protein